MKEERMIEKERDIKKRPKERGEKNKERLKQEIY